jgi:hypothetical protein
LLARHGRRGASGTAKAVTTNVAFGVDLSVRRIDHG